MELLISEFSQSAWIVAKILLLVFLALYIIFSVVVVKQVKLMSETLQLNNDKYIEYVAFVHLVLSILAFILALIIL